MIEDELLKLRFKAGSVDALQRIYEKYRDYLLTLAMALLNDGATAEDVLHDVFVSLAQSGSKSGVVWAEVARKVQASRGVIFRTTEHIVPDPYDSGVDFSMDHYSSTQSRVDKYKGGEISRTIYGNCNTKTAILVDHYHKSYVRMTLEKIMPDRFRMDPNSMVQRFLSCQHKELGQKVIDGVLCEGIETTDPAFYDGDHPPETLRSTGSTSIRC